MIKDIGICSIIDWNSIIASISTQEPGYIGPRQNWNDSRISDIIDIWKSAGYKPVSDGGSAEWHMFFPGTNFPMGVADQFAKFVGMDDWNSAWISRVMPGQCAPWHYDTQVEGTKNPRRIHCHIDVDEPGNVLIIDGMHLYNQIQGQMYEWSDPKLWHAAFNLGKKPAYLFNIY